MVVLGRKIFAKTLAERRLLLQIGGNPLRIPRGVNPYMVARCLARAVTDESIDQQFVRSLLVNHPGRTKNPQLSQPQPGTASAKSSVAA